MKSEQLKRGERYQFINKGSEPLVYVGKNGLWNQFEEESNRGFVWSEVLDSDLHLIEPIQGQD